MKICYINGVKTHHLQRMVDYFSNKKGYELHIITFNEEVYYKKGVCVHSIVSKLPLPLSTIDKTIKMIKTLKKIKPDIIHKVYLHFNIATIISIILSRQKNLFGTPLGTDILQRKKSIEKGKKPSFFRRALQEWFLKKSIICVPGSDFEQKLTMLGVPKKNIKLIYSGINQNKFVPGMDYSKLKNKFYIGKSKVILTISRYREPYGLKYFIKAVPLILASFPNCKFIIIGDNAPPKKEIQILAKKIGCSNSMIFVEDIKNDEMPKYHNLADVYVQPCILCGGASVSMLEAMACEKPVVVTDTGAYSDFVKNGYNGFLIPIKDHEVLADRIIELLGNNYLSQKFGKNARKTVIEKGTIEVNNEKLYKLYQEIFCTH